MIPRIPMQSGRPARKAFLLAVALSASVLSGAGMADPNDFQAMPGLWKVDTQVSGHGHAGKPKVKWHCVNEDNDPWVEFADLTVTGAKCTRGDEQRTSTSLAWTLTCKGHAPMSGRVDFDSTEHYTASITDSRHNRELVHVEGTRRAACADPND